MRLTALLVGGVVVAFPAHAQQRESAGAAVSGGGPPEQIVIPVAEPGCAPAKAADNTILVCGRRVSPYRIDPAIQRADQLRAERNRRPPNRGDVPDQPCNLIGPATPCPTNVIPVSSIAVTAVTALIKAIKGDDVRPMLRPEATDYELYRQAEGTGGKQE